MNSRIALTTMLAMAELGGYSGLKLGGRSKGRPRHEFNERELEKLKSLCRKEKKKYVKELNEKYDNLIKE